MKKKKKQILKPFDSVDKANVRFICLNCGEVEKIPMELVRFLDGTDLEIDLEGAPQFECESKALEMKCI